MMIWQCFLSCLASWREGEGGKTSRRISARRSSLSELVWYGELLHIPRSRAAVVLASHISNPPLYLIIAQVRRSAERKKEMRFGNGEVSSCLPPSLSRSVRRTFFNRHHDAFTYIDQALTRQRAGVWSCGLRLPSLNMSAVVLAELRPSDSIGESG